MTSHSLNRRGGAYLLAFCLTSGVLSPLSAGERFRVSVPSSIDQTLQPCYVILPNGFDREGDRVPLHKVRRVCPQEGSMFFFPSYFLHGTVPFESAEPRISIAFDLRARG